MPRFAFREPSIGSITTRQRPSPTSPTSSETIRVSRSAKRATTTRSAASSTAVVSSPPMPAPTTGSRVMREGRSASTARTSSVAARQTPSQSVTKRIEEEPGRQLGEEVRRLLGHHLAAARTLEHDVEWRRPQEERRGRITAVDGRDCLIAARGVRDPLRREPVYNLDVEHAVRVEQLVAAVAVEHDTRQLVAGLVDRLAAHPVHVLRDRVRRKDRQALLACRDEDDHHPRRHFGAVLAMERQRGLVTVLAAGH